MASDTNNLNAYAFIKDLKARLADRLEERLVSGEFFPLIDNESLEEQNNTSALETDWKNVGELEGKVILDIKTNGKMFGSDEGTYASGVLMMTFTNQQGVDDFCNYLENADYVDTYEIEAYREELTGGFVEDSTYDLTDSILDLGCIFNVFVYLDPAIVMTPAEDLEVDDGFEYDDDNGFLTEVRRKIKVNFRGKKRIKMQCSPGFKWDPAAKTCRKISGSQVAVMRKAMRRAVLTKKSMGQSFKARVVRKARKANRFRKSFGLG